MTLRCVEKFASNGKVHCEIFNVLELRANNSWDDSFPVWGFLGMVVFFFVEFCEVFMFMKTFVRRKLMGNVSVEIVMIIKM